MKVYVDELPKSCEECPCYSYSEGFCNCEYWWQKYKEIKDVQDYTHLGYKQNERPDDCPLQSLADYTKQVRREVVQELKGKVEKRNNGIRHSNHSEQYKDGYSGCCCDLEHILDQIQGKTNE